MELSKSDVDIFVPDGTPMPEALARTSHLCIGAHQDEQEFMAYHGIVECYGCPERWFSGVVVTNGAGSPRTGMYADHTDEEMMAVRREEQRKAARVGEYACQIQLNIPSPVVKEPSNMDVVDDLVAILTVARPNVVYLHNPADKHDTHVAVTLRSLAAIRALPDELKPRKVYGCEIWRSLDWLCDEDKQVLPVDLHPNLAASVSGVFDSQIVGGKRYDLAVIGRRKANATFFESHAADSCNALSWAMDLTPLVTGEADDVVAYTTAFVDRLRNDVVDRLQRQSGTLQ